METLSKIEKEIVDNQKKLNQIEYDIRENYTPDEACVWEHKAIEIEKQNKVLEKKRMHILDRRNGWRVRFIWSVLAPIIISIVTAWLIYYFNLK